MRITRNSLGQYVIEDGSGNDRQLFIFNNFSTVISYMHNAFHSNDPTYYGVGMNDLLNTGPRTSPSVSPSVSPSYSGSASPSPSLAPSEEEPEYSMPEYIPQKDRKKGRKYPGDNDMDGMIIMKEEE